MKVLAIERVRDELRRMKVSLELLESSDDYCVIGDAWNSFLIAASAIYEKYEKGVGTQIESRHWYASKVSERDKDELLNYLRHARNTDHHGIDYVIKKRNTRHLISIGGSLIKVGNSLIGVSTTVVELTPVKTKKGIPVKLPTKHLDQSLPDTRPATIANLAYSYFLHC